jgi:HEPN domain-containing protein
VAHRASDIRLFQRAAKQRLEVATFLLENGYHLDAVYLAGYAAECALKSVILKRTPHKHYREMFERITPGRQSHDLERLARVLRGEPLNCVIPLGVTERLSLVMSWSTDLRYQTGRIEYNEARRFCEATQRIVSWAEGS